MDPADAARARHRLYALLGRLVVEGPSDEALEVAAALPALASALPTGRSRDLQQADHLAAFGLETAPYESATLSADGLMAGDHADAVRRAYREGGFHPGRTDVEPDHLGLELAFLGHLCAAEAEARDDGAGVEPLLVLQRAFLDRHLLRWLPAFVLAVRALGLQPWTTVTELALELAASHRASLGGPAEPFVLEGPAIDLDQPDLGLVQVAERVMLPASSGWCAGRGAVGRISRAAGVPPGFGDRAGMLAGALFSAADAGRLPELVGAIDVELGEWDRGLADFEHQLGVQVGPWRQRIAITRAALDRIGAAAKEVDHG